MSETASMASALSGSVDVSALAELASKALEEGEEIELMPTKLDDAISMIKDGEIHDGKTIAALLMYDRFHRRTK